MGSDAFDPPAAHLLLKTAGIHRPIINHTFLKGGANNRVYKIELADSSRLILKHYFQHPQDLRPRLKAEYEFLAYAWHQGIRTIPKPLANSSQENIALYSFIDGISATPDNSNLAFVEAAITFLLEINRSNSKGNHLPKASEACLQINDYFKIVESRINRFLSPENEFNPKFHEFLTERLIPEWESVKNQTCKAALHDLEPSKEDLILSPSDFGLHNTLFTPTPHFIDFEYAGWDDPAKTICDFFLQPKIPIPFAYFPYFSQKVSNLTKNPEKTEKRALAMLPICKIKWCCIILNVFLKTGKSRRAFAKNDQLESQYINRAKQYLETQPR